MSRPPALQAVALEFGYPSGGPVLRGADLSVAPGEIVGVIGPNGSGKTTLLNLLARSLKPDRGSVRVFGRDIAALSARERAQEIAVVQQEAKVAFPFTVLEIALMGRAPYLGRWQLEAPGDLAVAAEALELTGVGGRRDRKFHELSGGEKQRVMVAKALAQRSRILLLDEPTAFLDFQHQVEIYELIRKLARDRELAVLAVSHDINLAAMYCDRLAALFEGRIAMEGAPSEVLTPSLLRKIYGVEIEVVAHPARGRAPLVFPLRTPVGRGGESGL